MEGGLFKVPVSEESVEISLMVPEILIKKY